MRTDWFAEITGAEPMPSLVLDAQGRDLGPSKSEHESRVRARLSQIESRVDARDERKAERRGPEVGSVDWWSTVNAAHGGQFSGTFETPSGLPHGVPKLMDSEEPTGLATAFRVGMIEDPEARTRALAEARFPGDPRAADRYGTVGGEEVFIGDDGSLRREMGTGGKVAAWLGENLPAGVGATVGAMMGGPPGAALGGAAGEALRKIGGEIQGDEQTVGGNVRDLATEAAFDWAGAKVGDLVGKQVVERRVVRDLPRFDDAATKRLQKLAGKRGIVLTPAEASNLGSLIQRQSMLGMGADDAADTLRQFYGKRADRVKQVIDDFIGATPPAEVAGRSARDVGKQAIADAEAARETATRASYRMLDRANPAIPRAPDNLSGLSNARGDSFDAIEADDLIAGYLDKAQKSPLYGLGKTPRNSFRVVDRAQKLMRDAAEAAQRKGENFEAAAIEGKRQDLLRVMEKTIPGYRDTRRAFAEQSKFVEQAEQGIEGVLAGLKDTRLRKAADMLLSPANADPAAVKNARGLFVAQGKQREWDAIVNQRLRDTFEKTKGSAALGDAMTGPKFRAAIFGSQRDRDIMRAAMGKRRFQDLTDLMDVLEAMGRVPKQQSITHFAGEAAKQEARAAAPVVTLLRNLKLSDPGGELLDALTDRSVEKWRGMLAKVITSPAAVDELKRLRVLRGMTPHAKAKLRAAATILQKAGVLSAESATRDRPTKLPPALIEP